MIIIEYCHLTVKSITIYETYKSLSHIYISNDAEEIFFLIISNLIL